MSTHTCKFDELPEALKTEALEEHWEINVDHDWWEGTFEHWSEKLDALGYPNADISFSGFSSQGDGASFTARAVPPHDKDPTVQEAWLQLTAAATLLGETVDYDLSELARGSVIRNGSSHYVHEYTVDVEWEHTCPGVLPPCESMTPQWQALEAAVVGYYVGLTETVRDLCRGIYADLEAEYEYQTGDERVAESLRANEMEFETDAEGDPE